MHPVKIAPVPDFMSKFLGPPRLTLATSKARGFASAFVLVVLTTAAIWILEKFINVGRVGGIYIIPVLFSAMRWGLGPGLLAAGMSVALITFFFAPPLFDLKVHDWEQFIRLLVFALVAVVSSRLAVSLKRHAETAERAVNEARMRAEADQLREALIGSVSHELRTPLASILGATSVLSSAPAVTADPKLDALANVVRGEAERLNNVIQNLLDATRISSDGLRPRFEWADVADIVNAAIERRRTRLDGHAVTVDIAPELPLVYVDQNMIEQALGQILDNAGKYSPPGSPIRVAARVEHDTVVVHVSDRGAGLLPEEQAHIGERFFRSERTAGTAAGSGLGVWIAKAFLHANGGSIDMTSSGVDQGTTFIIRLPSPAHEGPARETANE